MKKLFLLLMASATVGSATAQTIVKENRGLIGKISATWCYPCGSWGWTLMNDMITDNPNAFPISIFPDGNDGTSGTPPTNWHNKDFYNSTNVAIANMITLNGYPSYSANAKDVSLANTTSGVDTAGVHHDLNAGLHTFATAPVVAGVGMSYKITGNTIEVKAKAQFYTAVTGDYYMAIYLVENASHIQNGQGVTDHHNVLRASLSSSVWGEQVITGSGTANQTIDKTYTYTLTGDGLTKWDKTRFHPVAIIWKTGTGGKYDYVNGTEKYSYTTSVGNVANMNSLAIYPNPATDMANVSVVLANAAPVVIAVTDALGRVVYNSGELQFTSGQNEHQLNTSNLSAGVYNVAIMCNGDVQTQHLSIAK